MFKSHQYLPKIVLDTPFDIQKSYTTFMINFFKWFFFGLHDNVILVVVALKNLP